MSHQRRNEIADLIVSCVHDRRAPQAWYGHTGADGCPLIITWKLRGRTVEVIHDASATTVVESERGGATVSYRATPGDPVFNLVALLNDAIGWLLRETPQDLARRVGPARPDRCDHGDGREPTGAGGGS